MLAAAEENGLGIGGIDDDSRCDARDSAVFRDAIAGRRERNRLGRRGELIVERCDRTIDVARDSLVAHDPEATVTRAANAMRSFESAAIIAEQRVVRAGSSSEQHVMRGEQQGPAITQRMCHTSESARHAARIHDARALSNLGRTFSFGADSRCDTQSTSPLRA